jgi:hypothetical protein
MVAKVAANNGLRLRNREENPQEISEQSRYAAFIRLFLLP